MNYNVQHQLFFIIGLLFFLPFLCGADGNYSLSATVNSKDHSPYQAVRVRIELKNSGKDKSGHIARTAVAQEVTITAPDKKVTGPINLRRFVADNGLCTTSALSILEQKCPTALKPGESVAVIVELASYIDWEETRKVRAVFTQPGKYVISFSNKAVGANATVSVDIAEPSGDDGKIFEEIKKIPELGHGFVSIHFGQFPDIATLQMMAKLIKQYPNCTYARYGVYVLNRIIRDNSNVADPNSPEPLALDRVDLLKRLREIPPRDFALGVHLLSDMSRIYTDNFDKPGTHAEIQAELNANLLKDFPDDLPTHEIRAAKELRKLADAEWKETADPAAVKARDAWEKGELKNVP